MFHVSQYININ